MFFQVGILALGHPKQATITADFLFQRKSEIQPDLQHQTQF